MALTPRNDEAFFREVDEDLRRDRLQGFARRWGVWIAGAVVLLLAAVAIGLWWKAQVAARAGLDGERLAPAMDALEQGRPPADPAALAGLASSPRAGYRAASRLALADAAIAAGRDGDAAGTLAALAADADMPQQIRDLATIRGTALQYDRLPPAQVIDRLKGLTAVGNPWFGSAAEMTGAAWLKLGRADKAGPLFAAIARDATVPATLRARAAGMATALGQPVASGASAPPR